MGNSDTIRTPDPAEPKKPGPPLEKTMQVPSSWVEPIKTSLSDLPTTPATVVMPASLDEFPEEVKPFVNDPTHQINQYILVKVLGKGGMGEVWKAWDRKLTRWVAIKFLLGESAEGVARFKREAKMAARLSHPNIAPVHEVGEAASRQPGSPSCHFLAMEYIDGSSLAQAKLTLRDKVDVFVKVAAGVEAAHKGGVVHRDLKPANIMLKQDGWPYVMDFGLAKSLTGDNNLSATGAVMGTPAFMPPEQVEGLLDQIGPQSDVYSLGATMYAVFCGAHPFTAQTTLQLLQKVVNEAPPSPRTKNPEIPADLDAIILQCLSKKKEERYASAGAVGAAMKQLLARLDAGAAPPPAPAPVVATKSKPVWPILVVALLVIAGLGAGGLYLAYRAWNSVTSIDTAKLGVTSEVSRKPEEPKREMKVDLAKQEHKVEAPVLVNPEIPAPPKPEVKPEPVVVKPEPPKPDDPVKRGYEVLAEQAKASPPDYRATQALMSSPSTDPALRGKLAGYLAGTAWTQSPKRTVAAADRALALEASGDPKLRAMTVESAQYLIEVQGPKGTWNESSDAELRLPPPADASSALLVSGDPAPARHELTKQGTAKQALDGDLRTTMKALAALSAAERCGHRVPPETWKKSIEAVEASNWGNDVPYAVASLLMARQALGDAAAAQNPRIQEGVKWMAAHPGAAPEATEIAGALLGTPRFGEIDWRAENAKALAGGGAPPDGAALATLSLPTAAALAASKQGGKGRLEMKSVGGATNLMFVLDASGYMRNDLDGKERFDVAKEAIAKLVEKLPERSIVGLRVFGHRKMANEPGCETDSQLVMPLSPLNKRQLLTHLEMIQVKGWSPLTYSLVQTMQDVGHVPPDVDLAVVLLVDGLDTNRAANPVPACGDLSSVRPGMKVHVVGFNVEDEDVTERLKKMAAAGGGTYIRARSSKTMVERLLAATVGETDYRVLDANGVEVAKGKLGDVRELPEGPYTLICGKQQQKIWINPGQSTRILVDQAKLAETK